MPSNSLSYGESLISEGDIFFDKYAIGCQTCPWSCNNAAPNAQPDESVTITSGKAGLGSISTGSLDSLAQRSLKAVSSEGPQCQGASFLVKLVSGVSR